MRGTANSPASHPPCEDVSWKGNGCCASGNVMVILLVRMWVEKLIQAIGLYRQGVILLVRMWVENHCTGWIRCITYRHPPCEDVSWKGQKWCIRICEKGHPPCEDVSWKVSSVYPINSSNVILLVRMWVEKTLVNKNKNRKMSSSLWGCELKNTVSLRILQT